MELKVYPRLNRKSRLAMRRRKWRFKSEYEYHPRPHLIRRLMGELGQTEEWVRNQIAQERKFLLQYPQYF
jgi:hypothetical protein